MPTIAEQMALLRRGAVELTSEEDLRARIESSAKSGKPLRVKLGLDPTSADVHLGHTVVLRKLRQFQDLGHLAVLIIGDYTALVGDPSGRSKARPNLDYAAIERNLKTYLEQVDTVIKTDKASLEIRYNGEWFKALEFRKVIELAGKITVARVLERDDFTRRFKAQQPIGLHELLYPMMQAYDSVMVQADVELGGTDQLFNLIAGRDLMREHGMAPQVILTVPLLIGLDGSEKMSKSLGNVIGVKDDPRGMFGKTMSIPDALMENWFTMLTARPLDEVRALIAKNPRDAKVRLAMDIVECYHGAGAAEEQRNLWDKQVSDVEYVPPDVPEVRIPPEKIADGRVWIVDLLTLAGHAKTNGEARRLVQGGGVQVNFRSVADEHAKVEVKDGDVLKTGKKRWARVKIAR
jgi:tyrosyl-tRNA synthetase